MAEMITAIYEKGVLRPLEPLHLRERQQVRIQVVAEDAAVSKTRAGEGQRALRALAAAGLLRPKPEGPIPADPLSVEERQALADRLGLVPGKAASEMVLEDRGEW